MNTLLITPPFSQLNTPYPATCYLKGFLKSKGFRVDQKDLGIRVINKIFSKEGLTRIFSHKDTGRIGALKESYIESVEPVISFLQGKNPTLAHRIIKGDYLPQSDRFDSLKEDLFSDLDTQDKARYFSTLFLNDIGDYITKNIDQNFGFSRYSERLAISPSSYDNIESELIKETLITDFILEEWRRVLCKENYDVLCITIPFPGNLLSALKIAKESKALNPNIKVIVGGGWVNTELRNLKERRLFNYIDYVVLDDGEAPLETLLNYIESKGERGSLHRTYDCKKEVVYHIDDSVRDYKLDELPAPDYSGLDLNLYISLLDTLNPMHSLWNNGRWNKLTIAHGCYWKKCAFCDTTLPYICDYHQSSAAVVVDKIEAIISQTGETGFHFVDEAAPPALLREISIELLRRNISITWWTNIRFEKSFTRGLAKLLAKSGCIGVSGGVEVASDRLLYLMKKGVTVDQVASVTAALGQEGIMVHAYLMYGFPTQNMKETIDALEIVRQLFKLNLIQSAYWHQFSLTAHSGVGQTPKEFNIEITGPEFKGFAKNDLEFRSETLDPSIFAEGLRVSLYNFMRGDGTDLPLSTWFNFKIPKPSINKGYIENILKESGLELKDSTLILWLGSHYSIKEGYLYLYDNIAQERVEIEESEALFINELLKITSYKNSVKHNLLSIEKLAEKYDIDIDLWLSEETALILYNYGLTLI